MFVDLYIQPNIFISNNEIRTFFAMLCCTSFLGHASILSATVRGWQHQIKVLSFPKVSVVECTDAEIVYGGTIDAAASFS